MNLVKNLIIKKQKDLLFYILAIVFWLGFFIYSGFSRDNGLFLPDDFEEISIPDNTEIRLIKGGKGSTISNSFLYSL